MNSLSRCVLMLLLCAACNRSEPTAQPREAQRPAALDVPTDMPFEQPEPATAHVALPRVAAGVSLGMTLAEAESQLGHLDCHANKAGYQVCKGQKEQVGDLQHVELYASHDRVISVSFEGPPPSSPATVIKELSGRYGDPALRGMRERDIAGRIHEIYGWKDDVSLYSVRFMWRNTETDHPELVGTVTAIWDRKGYQQWEAETKGQQAREPI